MKVSYSVVMFVCTLDTAGFSVVLHCNSDDLDFLSAPYL